MFKSIKIPVRLAALILAASSVAVTLGCTRKASESSKLSLSIPRTRQVLGSGKAGALDTQGTLSHVVINVSGKGISEPIVYNWDSCKDCQTPSTAPSTYEFSVAQGEKLVQVLAVYEDASGKMQFYYGDSAFTASGVSVPVNITVEALGKNTTVLSGRVAGRYLTAPNVGPSGRVFIKYNHPNRPGIIIEKSSILNGWFQFFGLSGVSMTYEVQGTQAQTLFGGPKSLDMFAPGPQVFITWHPDMWRAEGGGSDYELEEPQISVLGYFGDAASIAAKKVCYNDYNTALTRLKMHVANSATPGSNITLYQTTIPTADLGLLFNAGQGSIYYNGGAGGDYTSYDNCKTTSGGQKYQDYLEILRLNLDGQGNDSLAGFTFPMQWLGGTDRRSVTIQATSATQRSVKGKVLPGVQYLMNVMTFYKRTGLGFDNDGGDDELDCAVVKGADSGFAYAGSATIAAADGALVGSLNLTQAEVASGSMIAACGSGPFGDLPTARIIRPWQVRGDAYSEGQSISLAFSGNGTGMTNTMGLTELVSHAYAGNCLTVRAEVHNPMGGTAMLSSPAAVTLDLDGPANAGYSFGEFYSDAGCATPVQTMTITPGGYYSSFFYFKATAPVQNAAFDSLKVTDPGGLGIHFDEAYSRVNVIAEPKLVIEAPAKLVPGLCYSVQGTLKVGESSYASPVASVALSGTDVDFFNTMADCKAPTGATTTLSPGAGFTSFYYYLKPGPTAGPYYATVNTRNSNTLTPVMGAAAESVEIQRVILEMPSPFYAGVCQPAVVKVVNRDNSEIPAPISFDFSLSYNSSLMGVYTTPSCYGSPTTGMMIASGQTRTTVYVMAFTTSAVPVSLTSGRLPVHDGGGNPLTAVTAVSPPATADYAYFSPPVMQTLLLGSHNFPAAGIPVPLTLTPAATDVTCRYATDGATFIACDALRWNSASKIVNWQAVDSYSIGNSVVYEVSYKYGGISHSVRFRPDEFYYKHFQPFKVSQCSVEITGASTTAAVDAAIDASHPVICFGPSAVVTYITAAISTGISNAGIDVALIGYVDLSNPGTLTTQFTMPLGANMISIPSGTGGVDIANIRFLQSSGTLTGQHAAVNMAVANNRFVRTINNEFNFPTGVDTSGYSVAGVYKSQLGANQPYNSFFDRFLLAAQTSGNQVFGARVAHDSSAGFVFRGATFDVSRSVGATSYGLEIITSTGSGNGEIIDSKFTGNGNMILMGATNGTSTLIRDSSFDLGSAYNTSAAIYITNGSLTFDHSRIVTHSAAPAIMYYGATGTTENNLFVMNFSTIVQHSNLSALEFQTNAASAVKDINFHPYHSNFVFMGSSASVPAWLTKVGAGGGTMNLNINGDGSTGSAGNRMCSGPSFAWLQLNDIVNGSGTASVYNNMGWTPMAASAATTTAPYTCD